MNADIRSESAINRCYFGDVRGVLPELIREGVRVQMCVTSPPYWGLRDYGVAGQLGFEKTPKEYAYASRLQDAGRLGHIIR